MIARVLLVFRALSLPFLHGFRARCGAASHHSHTIRCVSEIEAQ
jgi:hypothetical protein